MTGQNTRLWTTMVTVSMGLLVSGGARVWLTPAPPLPATQAQADSQHDHRLAQLEHAVTALTQALQVKPANTASPEPTCVTVQAADERSRQALAQVIRAEVRQAVADASPEAQ